MAETLILIFLKIFALLGGIVFAYLAAFTYESEDGEIQDKLERWWIELDDMTSKNINRMVRFLDKVSELCTTGFDKLFGNRLFSKHAVSVSVCLSLGTMITLFAIFIFVIYALASLDLYYNSNGIETGWAFLVGSIIFIIIGIGLISKALSPFKGKAPPIKTMYFIFLLLGCFTFLTIYLYHTYNQIILAYPMISIGLLLGVITDLSSIAITRHVLRDKVKGQSLGKYFSLVLGTFVLVIIIAAGFPLGLMGIASNMSHPIFSFLDLCGGFWLASNAPSFLSVSVFFLVSAILIMGRILSPVLSRIVYSGYRYRIVEKKKLLWSLSFGLLLASGIGPIRSIFESLKPLLKNLF